MAEPELAEVLCVLAGACDEVSERLGVRLRPAQHFAELVNGVPLRIVRASRQEVVDGPDEHRVVVCTGNEHGNARPLAQHLE